MENRNQSDESEKKNMTTNSYHHNHSPKRPGFKEFLRQRTWPNPFVLGR